MLLICADWNRARELDGDLIKYILIVGHMWANLFDCGAFGPPT